MFKHCIEESFYSIGLGQGLLSKLYVFLGKFNGTVIKGHTQLLMTGNNNFGLQGLQEIEIFDPLLALLQ